MLKMFSKLLTSVKNMSKKNRRFKYLNTQKFNGAADIADSDGLSIFLNKSDVKDTIEPKSGGEVIILPNLNNQVLSAKQDETGYVYSPKKTKAEVRAERKAAKKESVRVKALSKPTLPAATKPTLPVVVPEARIVLPQHISDVYMEYSTWLKTNDIKKPEHTYKLSKLYKTTEEELQKNEDEFQQYEYEKYFGQYSGGWAH